MIRLLSTARFTLCLVLSCGVILQGCASPRTSEADVKTGMYLDATLEFVVEYPLQWSKDRRLIFGRREGEVRWTPPDDTKTLLRIKSYVPKQQALHIEQQIDQALQEFVGLEVSTKELVTLPAGEAWHVTGYTAQVHADIYLLLRAGRCYSIDLTAPPDHVGTYKEVMDRITLSFQIMP